MKGTFCRSSFVSDATLLLRDIAGDTAQKAANVVRPSEDRLAQIDQPAPEGVWHEKPDMSKEGIKARMKTKTQKDKEARKGAAKEAGPAEQNGTVDGAVTEEAKSRRREATERTKEFLASKMPKERREQTVWRVKKMIVEIQGHSDYQHAIETLLSVAETYTGHTKSLSKQGAGTLKGAREESDLQKLETKLRQTLLERSANSTSLDDVFEAVNKIYKDADSDPRLREWFKSVNLFTR
ncbi:hypothetical protein CIHG_05267 [Coccidioides immitis H538.4]|uniref:HAM1-like N-terminal domain-containing protein n=1 Tax=Coccidioides immitis H538.4 TaxID=396776 RepID=A0A0J8RSA1_COCIT|nr:hypothetical protein CIHG_05267 [Coccidioides immitis H538.4]